MLLSVLFLGEKLTHRVALAAVCVAVAIGLLISHEFTAIAGRPLGIVWMEIAALMWAIGTLMMRRATRYHALRSSLVIGAALVLGLVVYDRIAAVRAVRFRRFADPI